MTSSMQQPHKTVLHWKGQIPAGLIPIDALIALMEEGPFFRASAICGTEREWIQSARKNLVEYAAKWADDSDKAIKAVVNTTSVTRPEPRPLRKDTERSLFWRNVAFEIGEPQKNMATGQPGLTRIIARQTIKVCLPNTNVQRNRKRPLEDVTDASRATKRRLSSTEHNTDGVPKITDLSLTEGPKKRQQLLRIRDQLLLPWNKLEGVPAMVRVAIRRLGGVSEALDHGHTRSERGQHISVDQQDYLDLMPGQTYSLRVIHALLLSYCSRDYVSSVHLGRRIHFLPPEALTWSMSPLSDDRHNALFKKSFNNVPPLQDFASNLQHNEFVSVVKPVPDTFCAIRANCATKTVTLYDVSPCNQRLRVFSTSNIQRMMKTISSQAHAKWKDCNEWNVQLVTNSAASQLLSEDSGAHAVQSAIDLIIFGETTQFHDVEVLRGAHVVRLFDLSWFYTYFGAVSQEEVVRHNEWQKGRFDKARSAFEAQVRRLNAITDDNIYE